VENPAAKFMVLGPRNKSIKPNNPTLLHLISYLVPVQEIFRIRLPALQQESVLCWCSKQLNRKERRRKTSKKEIDTGKTILLKGI